MIKRGQKETHHLSARLLWHPALSYYFSRSHARFQRRDTLMTQNTSFNPEKGAKPSNRCSWQEKKKTKQLHLAPGSNTDLWGLLNLRHLSLQRSVLAAEMIPGHELQRESSSCCCCCSSSHHFAFSLSRSLRLLLALPGLQQHSALMHTFSVSVPAAQKLTWLRSEHQEADKLKEKQKISSLMNEFLFLTNFSKLPFLILSVLSGLRQWSSVSYWIPHVFTDAEQNRNFQFRCFAWSISSFVPQLHNCTAKALPAGWPYPCSFTLATWKKVRSWLSNQRGAPWLLSLLYSSWPTSCEKLKIPCSTSGALPSPASSCSQEWRDGVCRNHVPQSLSLHQAGVGTARICAQDIP